MYSCSHKRLAFFLWKIERKNFLGNETISEPMKFRWKFQRVLSYLGHDKLIDWELKCKLTLNFANGRYEDQPFVPHCLCTHVAVIICTLIENYFTNKHYV